MGSLLIMHKAIALDSCEVLYETPFSDASLKADWLIRRGEWSVRDGWLTGRNPDNAPGMITSTRPFFGNVLLEFEARTVVPSTHDIDCMWNGSWDDSTDERGLAYVVGVAGWWEGKVGFEKSPAYALTAATQIFPFEPGRAYRIQAGSIDGHAFVFIDGRLVLEVTDPDPIDVSAHGLIGFEAYASHIQIRGLVVRQLVWTPRQLTYAPEF